MNYSFNPYSCPQSNVFNQILSLDWYQYNYFYLNQHYNFYKQNSPIENDICPNYQNGVNIQEKEKDFEKKLIKQEDKQQDIGSLNIQPENRLDDENKQKGKSQKEDRNLNSIVIRNFTNYVNGHPNAMEIISQIIQKKGLSMSADEYRTLFLRVFPLGQSYVGIGKLKRFLKKQTDARLITLILMRKFISVDYFTVMIHSKKVSKTAKLKELKHGKKLWTMLLDKIK